MGNLEKTDNGSAHTRVEAVVTDAAEKRRYVAPAIVVLGDIEELTKNGGGADMDITSSQPT